MEGPVQLLDTEYVLSQSCVRLAGVNVTRTVLNSDNINCESTNVDKREWLCYQKLQLL